MTTQTKLPIYQTYQLPIFIGILLLTFIARLHHITLESVWVDEGFSYWAIRHADIWGVLLRDVHPPLYFFGLRLWASLTDISEFALRYFSVLPSLLSVVMIYQVARELERLRSPYIQTPIPLLASLMLALADMETSMAQTIRMYTWHVLWVVCSAWAFLRFVRLFTHDTIWSRRVIWACVIWIATSVLLLYTQYVGLALIAVQGLTALLFLRGKIRLWVMFGCVLIGASFIPWGVAVVVNQTANVGTGFNVPSNLESLWNWRVNWFTQQWALTIGLAVLGLFSIHFKISVQSGQRADIRDANPPLQPLKFHRLSKPVGTRFIASLQAIPKIGFLPLLQSGEGGRGDEVQKNSSVLLKRHTTGRGMRFGAINRPFFLLMWIVIPVAGAYILNFYTPILMDYRLTQITPAVALLIAYGLGHFRGKSLWFIVVVLLIYGVATDDTPNPRPPFRDIGQFVARVAGDEDLLLAHVTPSGDWQMVYYYELYLPNVERRSLRQWQLEDGGTYYQGLRDLLTAHNGVWLMHWSSDMSSFEALRDTGYIQTAKTSWSWVENSSLDLYRYDRIPQQTLARFVNGMIIQQARISDDNNRMLVEIWWSSDTTLSQNYTVSAILLDENGRLVAQDDSYPFLGQKPTSTWADGEIVYDPHHLKLAEGITELTSERYTVAVKIYLLTDTLTVQPTEDGDELAILGEINR